MRTSRSKPHPRARGAADQSPGQARLAILAGPMPSVCSACHHPMNPGHQCPPQPGAELVGKVLDGRYRIESILGAGGMGMVFRATQTSVGREVAIKTLNPSLAAAPQFFERFKREAEVASRLKHPNVITVFDFGRADDGTCYFVMELLAGRSLKEVVKEEGALSLRRAVAIIEQACLGLAHAHNQHCVHRDLKPHNIMVQNIDGQEFVKVLDFGLVKAMEQEGEEQLTSTGQVLGTPQYMPPEQAGGEAVDLRSDLYSMGGVFYYCLTGSSPYGANSVRKALQAALTQTVPPVASRRTGAPVPKKVEEFIRKALARELKDRHQSCDEFIAELQEAIAGCPDAALDALPDSATPAAREAASGSQSSARRAKAGGIASRSRSQSGVSSAGSNSSAPSGRRLTTPEIPSQKAKASTGGNTPSRAARAAPPPEDPASLAEEPAAEPPRSKAGLFAALGFAALAAAAVGYLVLAPGGDAPAAQVAEPTRPPPAARPPPRPAEVAQAPAARVRAAEEDFVEVTLDSQPRGARITSGAEDLGSTPTTLRARRDEVRIVSFTLAGHHTVRRELNVAQVKGSSSEIHVQLPKRQPPATPPSRTTPKQPPKHVIQPFEG